MLKKILHRLREDTINHKLLQLEDTLKYIHKKTILEQNILFNKENGINEMKYCDHSIIVSLTTYGKRLYDVHLAIESIMEQTMKANRIILWLENDLKDFPLPKTLLLQQERGLEIRFCEDIRSYKKLIPTLELYPDDAIITIDDDLIYEFDLLENLIKPYLIDPQYIYCHRFHRMKFDDKNNLLPYKQWEWRCNDTQALISNFPTTGGGTLFPPNSLDKEVLNKKVFMDICKYADDIWFKAMSLKKGTLSKKVFSHNKYGDEFIVIPNNQDMGLYNINVNGESLNDKQLNDVFNKYKLFDLFINTNNKN